MRGFLTYSFILIIFLISDNLKAQMYDDNSVLIHNYFNRTNSFETIKDKTVDWRRMDQKELGKVQVFQIGNENYLELDARQSSQKVIQFGNNNTYEFFSYYSIDPSYFQVYQIGSYNNLQVYGENTIFNNSLIIQNSNFQTIQIRNF